MLGFAVLLISGLLLVALACLNAGSQLLFFNQTCALASWRRCSCADVAGVRLGLYERHPAQHLIQRPRAAGEVIFPMKELTFVNYFSAPL